MLLSLSERPCPDSTFVGFRRSGAMRNHLKKDRHRTGGGWLAALAHSRFLFQVPKALLVPNQPLLEFYPHISVNRRRHT